MTHPPALRSPGGRIGGKDLSLRRSGVVDPLSQPVRLTAPLFRKGSLGYGGHRIPPVGNGSIRSFGSAPAGEERMDAFPTASKALPAKKDAPGGASLRDGFSDASVGNGSIRSFWSAPAARLFILPRSCRCPRSSGGCGPTRQRRYCGRPPRTREHRR